MDSIPLSSSSIISGWRNGGGGEGRGHCPREIFADQPGKKRQGKKGKKENWRREGLSLFLKTLKQVGGPGPGGGHWPRKGVWGCAAVMTPFFQASRRSLAYQFTIIAPFLCPPFSNFRKFFHFQLCFGQKFQLSRRKFSKFSFPRPLILQGKSTP